MQFKIHSSFKQNWSLTTRIHVEGYLQALKVIQDSSLNRWWHSDNSLDCNGSNDDSYNGNWRWQLRSYAAMPTLATDKQSTVYFLLWVITCTAKRRLFCVNEFKSSSHMMDLKKQNMVELPQRQNDISHVSWCICYVKFCSARLNELLPRPTAHSVQILELDPWNKLGHASRNFGCSRNFMKTPQGVLVRTPEGALFSSR